MLGSLGTLILLAPGRFPPDIGWRLAFGIGAVLGAVVLVFRRFLPESPRWLMVHGRVAEAEKIVGDIERQAAAQAAEARGAATAGVVVGGSDVPMRIPRRAFVFTRGTARRISWISRYRCSSAIRDARCLGSC